MKPRFGFLVIVGGAGVACAANAIAPPRADVITEHHRPSSQQSIISPPGKPIAGGVEVVIGSDRLCVRIGHSRIECVSGEPTHAASFKEVPLRLEGDLGSFTETGSGTTCVIATRDGSVHCIGDNGWGELGAGVRGESSAEAVRVIGTSNITSITAGNRHVCGLVNDGSVRCWGRNNEGQTGSSTAYEQDVRELVRPSVVPLTPGTKLTKIAAADDATCGIAASRDHEVVCWGMISVLDDAGAHAAFAFKPTTISGATNAEDIAAGGESMCAVVNGGDEVVCWGVLERLAPNPNTRLYHATNQAVRIEGLHDVAKIGVASSYGCALHKNRQTISCWGRNTRGELGRGDDDFEEAGSVDYVASTFTPRPPPLRPAPVKDLPPGSNNIRSITVGYTMACAVTDSDDVWCWGQWPHAYDENDPYSTRTPIARRPKKLPLR